MKFALYFGNRGFFPGEVVAAARKEMSEAVAKAGHEFIMADASMTRYGAVETVEEGEKYAAFLRENRGNYDGVIVCLPNFGDENGAIAALKDCGAPILIQAYPDEIGKMDFSRRRDAYCGKFSIMDMFNQYKIPFTVFKPHAVKPLSEAFIAQIGKFARVCAVVKGMKNTSVGVIGGRVTAFKTVRYDELTLQRYGIRVDTFDLLELFDKVNKLDEKDDSFKKEYAFVRSYSDFSAVPENKTVTIAKILTVILNYVRDYRLDSIALRCWNEFSQIMGVSVCAIVSMLNERGIACACESDVCNAIIMRAMSLCSGGSAACLDLNNNYGEQENKCILFHCGPVAKSLMMDSGRITDHKMFAKNWGAGCAWGVCEGRIRPMKMTYSSCKTENGVLSVYIGKGAFTGEPIEEEFFGCGGVAEIKNLEDALLFIGRNGYCHHVCACEGDVAEALEESFKTYLNYSVTVL